MKEMDFLNSRTYANLMAAYAGESQAEVKYQFYSEKAKKDGYVQISQIFKVTSENEKAHASIWFKLLHDGWKDTLINLKDAAAGEHYEWSSMYSDFAKQAREEGFKEIAAKFEMVAKIEEEHEKHYNTLIQNMENNQVFVRPQPQLWICSNCGHEMTATDAPKICPVCDHPQAYFQIKASNY